MAGRVLTIWQAKAAVSSSNTRSDRSWPWLTGALESVSAMERSLPGTWDIEYVKEMSRGIANSNPKISSLSDAF